MLTLKEFFLVYYQSILAHYLIIYTPIIIYFFISSGFKLQNRQEIHIFSDEKH